MQFREQLKHFFTPLKSSQESFDQIKKEFLVDATNIFSKIKDKKGILLIWADFCGHCQRFKPNYIELYKMIKEWNDKNPNNTMHVFAMDSQNPANSDFMKKLNILGVPALFFIKKDGKFIPYEKSRDPNVIFEDLKQL